MEFMGILLLSDTVLDWTAVAKYYQSKVFTCRAYISFVAVSDCVIFYYRICGKTRVVSNHPLSELSWSLSVQYTDGVRIRATYGWYTFICTANANRTNCLLFSGQLLLLAMLGRYMQFLLSPFHRQVVQLEFSPTWSYVSDLQPRVCEK